MKEQTNAGAENVENKKDSNVILKGKKLCGFLTRDSWEKPEDVWAEKEPKKNGFGKERGGEKSESNLPRE